jgi:AhpD family alkylhydroperoxidase
MLPAPFRYWLFDKMSTKTMRYVTAVPHDQATGLTQRVYEMIREDFFRNGSLTSRSAVPELLAAIWTAGREAMLVEDRVDRTTKDAICAVLSQINDCPYCEDMLVSLVHAGGEHDAARDILARSDYDATDPLMRERLDWVRAVATPGDHPDLPTPFTRDQIPEVLGTLMAMADINRYSHVVMADSPVSAPLGLQAGKAAQIRLFGSELVATRRQALEPGRALSLLPEAELPEDLAWARSNQRVADALARSTAAVEREAARVIPAEVRETVEAALADWQGEQMPISRSWVEPELGGLTGQDRLIARLAIVLAKAPFQVDEVLAETVLEGAGEEPRFVRILAWASFTGARRFANILAARVANARPAAPAIVATPEAVVQIA